MHLRNELRLLAGIAIDPKLEVSESNKREKLTESAWSSRELRDNLDDAYKRLGQATRRGDQQEIARVEAELEELEHWSDEREWMNEGKKSKKADKDYDGDGKVESEKDEVMGSRMKAAKKAGNLKEAKKADKDYDGDGKIESSEDEHKGVVDKAIKKSKKKDLKESRRFTGWPEWEQEANNITNGWVKFEDEGKSRVRAVTETGTKGLGTSPHEDERTVGIWDDDKGEGIIYESTLNFRDDSNMVSWEDDEAEPVSVSGQDAQNDNTVWEPLDSDKDESPHQLSALGNQSSEEHDQKIAIPTRLLQQLKDVVTEARAEADKTRNSYSRYETTKFYDDYANACEQLHDHLQGGTVGDMKKAQIHMSSLMGPMLHKIPDDVNDFVMRGGQNRSLKDHFFKVQGYPIEGPRNKLS